MFGLKRHHPAGRLMLCPRWNWRQEGRCSLAGRWGPFRHPGKVPLVALMSLGAVAVAAAASIVIGALAFRRKLDGEVAELFGQSAGVRATILDEAEVAGLPEPVQRWLRYSGVLGTERPVTVRLRQQGQFRLGEERPWMPFHAEEYFTTDPPGFVWVASMRAAPLVTFTGRDRYFLGRGDLQFRALSLIPVASARGPEIDQGSLLRYLNELMWFPSAAVSPYITWEGVEANTARATITYAGIATSASFVFDAEGRVVTMEADRYRMMDHGYALQRWATPIAEYGELRDVRIPVAGEGVWRQPGGDFSYVKLRVLDVEYNVPMRY